MSKELQQVVDFLEGQGVFESRSVKIIKYENYWELEISDGQYFFHQQVHSRERIPAVLIYMIDQMRRGLLND